MYCIAMLSNTAKVFVYDIERSLSHTRGKFKSNVIMETLFKLFFIATDVVFAIVLC